MTYVRIFVSDVTSIRKNMISNNKSPEKIQHYMSLQKDINNTRKIYFQEVNMRSRNTECRNKVNHQHYFGIYASLGNIITKKLDCLLSEV